MDNSLHQFPEWSLPEVLKQLNTSEQGLSHQEALNRLHRTQADEKPNSRFKIEVKLFIRQFTNPLVLLLEVAVILSAVLGETSDALITLCILLASGLMGFWQERNAGRAAESLRKMISVKHDVLRSGQSVSLETAEIVPGDIITFNAGDIIPADCRIIHANELHVNESALTGESFPVEKDENKICKVDDRLTDKKNSLWQGTSIISGTALAVVVNTGKQTLFGNISKSLDQTPDTAFEKGIRQFGFFLLRITVILSVFILLTNIYFKKPIFDSVLFSLALAIGMAPELLPAIMTFAMSAGSKRMLDKKVIVKKLSSIFNFGEVTVLCTDKTGTVTEGIVTLQNIYDPAGNADDQAALYAYLNAALQQGFTNPIDEAIKTLKLTDNGFRKVNEIPYDFIRKKISVLVSKDMDALMITKGAVPDILKICSDIYINPETSCALDASQLDALNQKFSDWCNEGYRVIALATKSVKGSRISQEDESNMVFRGFILLEDPIKSSAVESIATLKNLNVAIKIITGDNRYAAGHIATKLGLNADAILTGTDLNLLSPDALRGKLKQCDIFAEIEPHQKERIVRALQQSGDTVAYIGDGINDVAAIHAADCGISASNAVDVAREAADFVLLDNDLSVLAEGVKEGRKSFINSMKYIFINTGATFGNMLSVAAASLYLPFLPLLPKQILLTNFITDFPYLAVASDHVDEEQLRRPRKWNMKLIRNFMIVFGIHSSLFDFITFYTLFGYLKLQESAFQTGWFLESVITELLILFIIRTDKPFFKSTPGKMLLYGSVVSLLFTIVLPFSPLAGVMGLTVDSSKTLLCIGVILTAYVLTADLLKIYFFRHNRMDA